MNAEVRRAVAVFHQGEIFGHRGIQSWSLERLGRIARAWRPILSQSFDSFVTIPIRGEVPSPDPPGYALSIIQNQYGARMPADKVWAE